MWIKKTDKEILDSEFDELEKFKKTRLKKSIRFSIWTFISCALILPIDFLLFGVPNGRFNHTPNRRIDWNELPDYINGILIISILISISLFLVSFFWGKRLKSSTLMCDKCHLTKNYSDNKICDCGGNFDLIENYRWIEENQKIEKQ